MNGKHYKLRFLSLFEDDLSGIVDYIAYRLKNPIAADQLVDAVQEAIRERTTCAEALDRKSTRLNSSHVALSRMPSSA